MCHAAFAPSVAAARDESLIDSPGKNWSHRIRQVADDRHAG